LEESMTKRIQRIQRIGNSAGILLPSEWLSQKNLKPGAKVRLEITDQRISVFPDQKDQDVEVDERFAKEVHSFLRRHREILERLAK
jgi:antitoxin component of MazEF toxin-antitoxin module